MSTTTGTGTLKERQRAERETLILQTAEELLLEKGYYEMSMDEIAARVGISKGTVYLHFPGKEELVVALLQRRMETMHRLFGDIFRSEASPTAKLQAFLDHVYGGMTSQHYQMFFSLYQNPEMRTRWLEKKASLQALQDDIARQLTDVFEEGKASGNFDRTIPTTVMLHMLTNLLSPRSYEQWVVQGEMAMADVVQHLSQFFFKGIAAQSSHERKP